MELRIASSGIILVCALCVSLQSGRADDFRTESVRIPAGIAVPDRQLGIVSGKSGKIEAVDLTTGKVIWNSQQHGEPILAVGDRLFIKVPVENKPNALKICVLSLASQGEILVESKPVVFDDWVSINSDYGRTFSYNGTVQDQAFVLNWEAHSRYAGGAQPTPEIAAAAKKDKYGQARIDLKTGAVKQVAETEPVSMPFVTPETRELSYPYRTGTGQENQPLVVGNIVALMLAQSNGEQLILRRWDRKTEKQLKDVVIGRGVGLIVVACQDGQNVMTRAATEPNDPWRLYSIESGKQIGSLSSQVRPQAISIVDSTVYYSVVTPTKPGPPKRPSIQPRVLTAIHLENNKELWSHPIHGIQAFPALPLRQ